MTTVSAGTKGFLFCDLRGYTAFIEQRGDQAAAELLATYRELVRGVIAAKEGAEIRTEGDSVYVVFPAASGAVEAGLGIVAGAAERSTRERPIAVGVGVHAGETVATTEGLVGGAVNIAARVCAKAQAGEVLVTDTVRALTRTYLPYRYTSLGTQSLKGIAGGIPLYRVEAVPTSGRARLRRQLGARRGRLVLLGGLVAVLAVGAVGAWALNRPADCLTLPATTKDVVARIDPARNCVVAVYPVGQRPGGVVATKDAVWVANVDDHTISVLDPTSGTTHTTGAMGTPVAIAAGPGNVYVLTLQHQVAVLPVGTGRVIQTIDLAVPDRADLGSVGYTDLAIASGRIWVTNAITGDVVRSDVFSGESGIVGRSTIHLADPALIGGAGIIPNRSSGIGPITSSGGTVWVADRADPNYYRLDASSTRPVTVSTDLEHGGVVALAATQDLLWLLHEDGFLTRVDAGSGATSSSQVASGADDVAAGPDGVWVADPARSSVARVDTETGQVVSRIRVGGHPTGIAIAPDDSVWVTIAAP